MPRKTNPLVVTITDFLVTHVEQDVSVDEITSKIGLDGNNPRDRAKVGALTATLGSVQKYLNGEGALVPSRIIGQDGRSVTARKLTRDPEVVKRFWDEQILPKAERSADRLGELGGMYERKMPALGGQLVSSVAGTLAGWGARELTAKSSA